MGGRIDALVINFSKALYLVPHDRLLTKIAASRVDSKVVVWIREFLLGPIQRVRVGWQLLEEVLSIVRSTARKCTKSTTVPRIRKLYLEKY
jgi:hypothetical protein